MNNIYTERKNTNKKIAAEIRSLKRLRKQDKAEERKALGYTSLWNLQNQINEFKNTYRISHIAMSMFRGKTYEQIEPNVGQLKELSDYDKTIIEALIDELKEGAEENEA